ncbi:MAG: chromosome partitioning protein ParA, partial [Bacteroidales bacterium]|nr:chromosome partitioning protein ParA [Bacteroidales bacterium]
MENLNNNFVANQEEESTLLLKDIWGMIWGYKWWYVASVIFCLMVVMVYIYRTPDTYQRTAKVIIDETEQSSTLRNLTQLTGGMTGLRANATVANEMEAFSSPDLMQKVVERLHLETRYYEDQFLRSVEYYQNSPVELRLVEGNPQNSFAFTVVNLGDNKLLLKDFVIGPDEVKETVEAVLGQQVETPAGVITLLPTMYIEDFKNDIRVSWSSSMSRAKAICQSLSVSLSGKESTVVVLSLEDTYPGRANAILNTLIDTYNEDWIRNKNRSARNTSDFINERLILIEKELGGVESELKAYKEQNNLSDMNAIAQMYLKESSEYSAKAFEVNNQLSVANFIKEYLNDPANATALIPANLGLASGSVETQIAEYNDLVLQRDRLAKNSGSNNPLIADQTEALAAMRTAILRSIDNYVSTLEMQAQKIESQEKQILDRIAASSGQELELLSIQRQQAVKESLYLFLLQKREENEIAALVNVGNTRLIQNPNGSPYPVAPNKMMLLLVAMVLGCGLPFAVIFMFR